VAIYEIPIEVCHEYDTWQWIYVDARKTDEDKLVSVLT